MTARNGTEIQRRGGGHNVRIPNGLTQNAYYAAKGLSSGKWVPATCVYPLAQELEVLLEKVNHVRFEEGYDTFWK